MTNRPIQFVFGSTPYQNQTIKFKEQEIPISKIQSIICNILKRHNISTDKKNELYSDCLSNIPEIAISFNKSELEDKNDNIYGYIKACINHFARKQRAINNVVQTAPKDCPHKIANEIIFFESFEAENSAIGGDACKLQLLKERELYTKKMLLYIENCLNNDLNKKEKFIIEKFFGLNGNEQTSVPKIAKILKESKNNTRCILENAFVKLKQYMKCVEEKHMTPIENFIKTYKDSDLEDKIEFMFFIRGTMKLLNYRIIDMAGFTGIGTYNIRHWRLGKTCPEQKERIRIKRILLNKLEDKLAHQV